MTTQNKIEEVKVETVKKTESKSSSKDSRIVVVRVRGKINLDAGIKKTFDMLNLFNKNGCVVLDNTPSNKGMIIKIKDYVTWGELDEDLFKEMVEKKADIYLDRLNDSKKLYSYSKHFTFNKKNYKKFIRLEPPVKGFGVNGIKKPFSKGGALGYRAKEINDLLKRMM
jgi:large subunit ribosomal protein L30